MRATAILASVLFGLVLAVPAARADGEQAKAPSRIDTIPPELLTDGFLHAHPDLDYRLRGVALDRKHSPASALKEYRRAAYYGDKPSQARIGEMYWNGEGVDKDPVLGFLWMALAAEREQREFSLLKLFYWQHLDEAQQSQARERAPGMLAEHGDAVAKHRLAVVLRREQRRGTGGLLGYNPAAGALFMSNGLDPALYYAETFWKPEEYMALRDRMWEEPLQGQVQVGDVEQLPVEPAVDPAGD